MDTNKVLIVLAVAVVASFAFTACTAAGVFDHDDCKSGEKVYSIYLGLSDSETGEEYDQDEAMKIMDAIVLKYGGGLTSYKSSGAWTDDGGKQGQEPSLVYVLVGYSLEDVHKICDEAKDRFNQSSILITTSMDVVEFYRKPFLLGPAPGPGCPFSDRGALVSVSGTPTTLQRVPLVLPSRTTLPWFLRSLILDDTVALETPTDSAISSRVLSGFSDTYIRIFRAISSVSPPPSGSTTVAHDHFVSSDITGLGGPQDSMMKRTPTPWRSTMPISDSILAIVALRGSLIPPCSAFSNGMRNSPAFLTLMNERDRSMVIGLARM